MNNQQYIKAWQARKALKVSLSYPLHRHENEKSQLCLHDSDYSNYIHREGNIVLAGRKFFSEKIYE